MYKNSESAAKIPPKGSVSTKYIYYECKTSFDSAQKLFYFFKVCS